MLRIGKLTDYAILIMSQLAKEAQQTLSATQLAALLFLSATTVSKILKILSNASLVVATRGAGGGYQLAKPTDEINILMILEAMEGGVAFTNCCKQSPSCQMTKHCMAKENWKKLNQLVYQILSNVSLSDMLNPLNAKKILSGLSHGE